MRARHQVEMRARNDKTLPLFVSLLKVPRCFATSIQCDQLSSQSLIRRIISSIQYLWGFAIQLSKLSEYPNCQIETSERVRCWVFLRYRCSHIVHDQHAESVQTNVWWCSFKFFIWIVGIRSNLSNDVILLYHWASRETVVVPVNCSQLAGIDACKPVTISDRLSNSFWIALKMNICVLGCKSNSDSNKTCPSQTIKRSNGVTSEDGESNSQDIS